MFRKIVKLTLIVCALSLLLYQNVSYGYPENWQAEERKLSNTYNQLETAERNFKSIRSYMKSLIGDWEDNEDEVKKGWNVTLDSAAAVAVAVVTTYCTGGTSAVAYAPAVFAGWLTAKSGAETLADSWSSQEYLDTMGITLSTMDLALSNVNAALSGGKMTIDSGTSDGVVTVHTIGYLAQYNLYLEEAAGHNLIRRDNPNYVYDTKEKLDLSINSSFLDDGYYHTASGSGTNHGFSQRIAKSRWDRTDLLRDKQCKGPCTDKFRSPHEAFTAHRKKCGTGENLDDVESRSLTYADYADDYVSRKVADGCGRHYYHCPRVPDTDHEPQTCSTSGCSVQYRNCLKHTKDHSNHSTTTETTQNEFQQPPPTPPPAPAYHPCGVHATSVSGTHSAAGCGVSGHYVCDGSDHSLQASCTTTNASGQSCTVSSFYACQSHTHVYPAPPAISCGRSGCTQTVSSSTEHQVTCSAGHQYWSCGQYANWHANHHRTRTCRYGQCRQSWQRCSRPSSAPTPMCNSPSRSGERCWAQ